jgi:CPA2 family monovalent cation:H+ antiporter-2
MAHDSKLIALVAIGFVLALAFGFLAASARLPPLLGYLLAGVAIGPFTPGFVGDTGLASELAEIGVILLMFGVGLHFSLDTLLKEQRNELDTENGRIAVGWLIVEDLATVLALVSLPALAQSIEGGAVTAGGMAAKLGITTLKVAIFVALMLVGGRRVVPWILNQVARTGSRELFTLAVLAIALGIAYGSAMLFDVSFARSTLPWSCSDRSSCSASCSRSSSASRWQRLRSCSCSAMRCARR